MFQSQKRMAAPSLLKAQYSFLCVVLVWCLLVSTVYAQANYAQEKSAAQSLAAQLFKLSGLEELIVQIPDSSASSFESALTADQLPDTFSDVSPDSIRTAVSKSFAVDTFNKYLIKEIDQSMSVDSIDMMLDWYASPLGMRIKQAEIDNSLLSVPDRFEAYQQQLPSRQIEAEREQMIFDLDKTMRSSESAVDMMSSMQIAFNISLSRFLPEDQQLSRAEIESLARQNHSRLMTYYRNQTREVLLFTYQSFDTKELEQLEAILSGKAGQEFVAAINNGIKKGLFAASLDLGDELGALLANPEKGPGI